MIFSEFKVSNFKGIKEMTLRLDSSPETNVYTFIGLNESGKTTILEAINSFNPVIGAPGLSGSTIEDYNSLIPMNERANFNGTINVEVTLKIDEEDLKKINEFTEKNTHFSKVKPVSKMTYYNTYTFKNSKFIGAGHKWKGFDGLLKGYTTGNYVHIAKSKFPQDNLKLAKFCRTLIPSILYFPSFLIPFPSKIYLNHTGQGKEQVDREEFYKKFVQDILNSLAQKGTNVETHIIARVKSGEHSDKQNLARLLQLMSAKVTQTVFDAWNKIFQRKMEDTKVVIRDGQDSDGSIFLDFSIEAPDGVYNISDKSLGFRWFFAFLLFTNFRIYREDTPKNIVFLFDEPASNLHPSAQKLLLKNFETFGPTIKIIYTTHSHYLINPHWLESSYIVRNKGIDPEASEIGDPSVINITIQPYREFVSAHPNKTDYFQPVLDVLEYMPSDLEKVPDCVFLEGKNDYYALAYFSRIIFNNEHVLNLSPGTGSGALDTLISLYLGWGKKFIIILDSDREGRSQKDRYLKTFGLSLESIIFTLEDIDPSWNDKGMEKLFNDVEALSFQQTAYPGTATFNKTHFNRAIQENLIKNKFYNFSNGTLSNFGKIIEFADKMLRKT